MSILKKAFLNATGTAAYVTAVGSFLFYAPKVFGRGNSVLIPITMLLLFVFSAAPHARNFPWFHPDRSVRPLSAS